MKVFQTNEIRNIALIGGAKTGKTTLAEDMLFEGGVINRRGSIEDKNTVSDYRDIELERQNSVYSSVLYTLLQQLHKINIIDTPGFDDFVGEVISALKSGTMQPFQWSMPKTGSNPERKRHGVLCAKLQKPVIFAINHLEHDNSNFDDTVNQLKQCIQRCSYRCPVSSSHRPWIQFDHRPAEDENAEVS